MKEFFDISYTIKGEVPKFKIKLKRKFTEGKDYPTKESTSGKLMPLSSSSVEFFNYFFNEEVAKNLYLFRKDFFNQKHFLNYLNINEVDLKIINDYFCKIKNKEKANHTVVAKSTEYRDKLKEGALRNKEEKRLRLINKFKDKDKRDFLVKNLHSDAAKEKRIASFKNTMAKDDVKKSFLEKIRSEEVSCRKSASLKSRWSSLSDDDKKKQIQNFRYKKSHTLNNIKMNLNEYVVGSILNDLSINWSYEKKIDVGANSLYPDFIIDNKFVIECYGTYWHADPRKFSENDIFFGKYTARDIWNMDSQRVDKLKNIGYKVLIVWEEDIHNDSNKIIEQIRSFYE